MDFEVSDIIDLDEEIKKTKEKTAEQEKERQLKDVKKGSMKGNVGPVLEEHLEEMKKITTETELEEFLDNVLTEVDDNVAREKFRLNCRKRRKFLDRYRYVYTMYMSYAGLLSD